MVDRPGARVWYGLLGQGSPLLLIQGLGYPSDASWRILPALSARHTVVLMDNRGVGRSDVPEGSFTIADMAGDAAAVIETENLGPVHVVGFSMGGLIAQELALSRPDLVRTLALGCTSPGGKAAVPLSPEVAEQFAEWRDMSPSNAARRAARVIYAKDTPSAAIEADIAVRMGRPTSRKGYLAQLTALAAYSGTSDRLDDLAMPVLVVQGTADRIVPPDNAEVLARAIPQADVRYVEGAGHILITDATDELTDLVLTFLEVHESGRGDRPQRAGGVLPSTMDDDFALSVSAIIRHAEALHGDVEILAVDDYAPEQPVRRVTVAELIARSRRLAGALSGLGLSKGARVGTLMWNTTAHLEAYLAVPSVGLVLHTVNPRLFQGQIEEVITDAADEVILLDASLAAVLAPVLAGCPSVRHVIVDGDPDREVMPRGRDETRLGDDVAEPMRRLAQEVERAGVQLSSYESIIANADPVIGDVTDERTAGAICYTSGTTGRPKGVVYSHRSIYLHAVANLTAAGFGIGERDIVLQLVPMFHANGWGFPYAALLGGAGLLLPGRDLTPEHLTALIEEHRPTVSGGVPTVWRGVMDHARAVGADLSSLRVVSCAGSAVPESLLRDYVDAGIEMYQAWGMTETSPLAAIARPPARDRGRDEWYWRTRTGRAVPGVEIRAVTDAGDVAPRDGRTVGELQVRGPWVTAGYAGEAGAESFDDGWLCTGDVGTIDDAGAMKITDRLKDLIKSGGEWISSTELEDRLSAHPGVVDAAVIGVPDPTWQERPLALVVLREDTSVTPEQLRAHLAQRVARWQVPDRILIVETIPRTGVGKIDKTALRRQHDAPEGIDVS